MERYSGIRPTGIELTRLRSRIGRYFSSDDKEMMNIGQKLCHYYRIDYYVFCQTVYKWNTSLAANLAIRGLPNKRVIISFSLRRYDKYKHHTVSKYKIRLWKR